MSIVYNSSIVRNNLIGHYDPANSKSYPGSGSAVTDLAGTIGAGTLTTFTKSAFAGGTWLNASMTQAASTGISIPLTNFNKRAGSIDIWAYPTSWTEANGLFMNRSDATPNAVDWLWVGVYNSGSALYFRIGDGSTCCTYDNAIGSWSSTHLVNTWGHYVFTWSSNGTSNIYFNGVLKQSVTQPLIPNTNPTVNGTIGLGHPFTTNASWIGYLGPAKFYNVPLTQDQVLQNFNASRIRFGL